MKRVITFLVLANNAYFYPVQLKSYISAKCHLNTTRQSYWNNTCIKQKIHIITANDSHVTSNAVLCTNIQQICVVSYGAAGTLCFTWTLQLLATTAWISQILGKTWDAAAEHGPGQLTKSAGWWLSQLLPSEYICTFNRLMFIFNSDISLFNQQNSIKLVQNCKKWSLWTDILSRKSEMTAEYL